MCEPRGASFPLVSPTIPPEAICALEGCGHRYDLHPNTGLDFELCGCEAHYFVARRLAGGALTPDDERIAYEEAMNECH